MASPLRAASDHLLALAPACAAGGDAARLRLVAHLFALCTLFHDHNPAPTWARPGLPPLRGWADLPRYLGALAACGEDTWYQGWVDALETLDRLHEPCFGLHGGGVLPPVELDPVALAGEELSGRVTGWYRPASALRRLRERRDGGSGPLRYDYLPGRRLRHLSLVWDRGPGPRVAPVSWDDVAPDLQQAGRRLERGDGFRVALCPLAAGVPRFRMVDGLAFRADAEVADVGALRTHVHRLMEDCDRARVDLLVLPELTMHPAAVREIAAALQGSDWPRGVVAGSWHVDRDGQVRNAAPVLDEAGGPLWEHHKRGHFRLRGKVVRDMDGGLFAGPVGAIEDEAEVVEGITKGAELRVLDSTLGRVAVLVCADALDRPARLTERVEELGVDLLLVVAMSDRTLDFLGEAEKMRRAGTAVLFVNAGCMLPYCKKGEDLAAFAALPFKRAGLPACVRWRAGADRLEGCVRVDQGGLTEAIAPDGAAIVLLPEDRGLVLELGAWWRETPPAA